MTTMNRRRFIQIAAVGGVIGISLPALMACDDDDSSEVPDGASSTATATTATTARRGPSNGELRISEPFLPAALDPDSGTASFNLMALGVAESLMRYTPTLQVEPWLAKGLERIDDLTWRVTLRDDATFWDGTKVDAQAVQLSLTRSMEKQAAVADLLPKGTVFTADGLNLTIATPTPVGLMARNLAAPNLAIKKAVTDTDFQFTGPFQVTAFTPRDSIELTAFEGYRGGPAGIKTIQARQVADTGARSLALQAGDVQIAQALLPSDVPKLKAANLNVFSAPWARQHMIILNVQQAPLDDAVVRRAFSLAIDRAALVNGVLEGVGAPAYGIAPEEIGFKSIVRTQKSDAAEARRILDAAGWKTGGDGIREKDGNRLSFKLGTYAGRAELEQFAVVIIDMAKAAGMEVTIEKFADVEQTLAANAFSATTYSIGSAAFGDLSRLLATLYTPSPRNKDRYSNERVNTAFQELLRSSDQARQDALLKDIQTWIGEDVPIVHLVNPYQVVGASKQVRNFEPHPLDSYKYHADMQLGG
ncbi:MAG: ABC transporter substrate-binding protein [Dehalococcoidia bacterium]